jgi:hypothetical protein
MAAPADYLVSTSGQMSVPAEIRHRWGLDNRGRIVVIDLGEAVVLLPPGGGKMLLAEALSVSQRCWTQPSSVGPADGVPFHIL